MTSIKDSRVWITGASSGIGRALALEVAKRGGKLIISARNEQKLQELASYISENHHTPCKVIPIDLSDGTSIHQALRQVGQPVDILVNNGGISQRDTVENTNLETYRHLMEVNYFGAIHLTKGVLPDMLKKGSGHIVAMSSVAGKIGTPKRSGYAAAKHAIHGFMDSLRAELEDKGIRATTICGGYIKTDISRNALKGDGTAQNTMDKNQENGLAPDVVAARICNAIENNKAEVYIGGREIMGIYIGRYFPSLLRRIVKKVNPK